MCSGPNSRRPSGLSVRSTLSVHVHVSLLIGRGPCFGPSLLLSPPCCSARSHRREFWRELYLQPKGNELLPCPLYGRTHQNAGRFMPVAPFLCVCALGALRRWPLAWWPGRPRCNIKREWQQLRQWKRRRYIKHRRGCRSSTRR